MTKRILSSVSFVVAFAILVPLSITTSASEVNCRVPFSFIVGGQTMSPGLYSVSTSQGYMILRGARQNAVVLTLADKESANGQARLVFLKTGDRYDLAEVWRGDGTGLQIPPPKHRADTRLASNASPERVVVLADGAAGSH
ncbi:MAG TPA: hypothetical protein VH138_04130 [Vicinamibacterales bacterium]|jgi:hypothetical protein|nr:hypothetical protein [Vicinamibacterales bacterium]